ncbi:neocarzinostatin apoprotein domain-containing protein [Streptomyces sp. RPT161]|uniref:neocarzinostatin apoprotein domain-containing protein n=1 Tax=Streptomyces sp. RPT161 TaxID=3015993 RepID=UPI0022B8B1CD|nr:neocarzinostatin apoprotein domain-containing protein [Streptomyces sp. RPT161]
MTRRNRCAAAVLALLLPLLVLAAPGPATADGATVRLSAQQAGAGGTITVTGTGWRPSSLLTMLICGQNAIGGTNSCANATGRAVTTNASGAFSERLPVAEPPKPCPCVVHVATVVGDPVIVDAAFSVAGHPVAPLPPDTGGGRLAALAARLDGSSGLLTWFGAPAQRRLVLTVGNMGSDPAKDPVFKVGLSHGVYAPQWQDQRWQGTVNPGAKAQVSLPVELAAGAHGEYRVTLEYGGKVLVEQPWRVSRPWGVTLFWTLLFVVVPAGVFRIGMAVVDRLRPPTATRRPAPVRPRTRRGTDPDPVPATSYRPAGLPWFAPDNRPGDRGAPSAPSTDDHPTAKGST